MTGRPAAAPERATRGGIRPYLVAYTVTMLGDRFAEIALPITVLAATSDPAAAGAVAASVQVPGLVFALGLGQRVDRGSRRTMLVVADVVRAAGFGAFALLAAGSVASLAPYLVVGTVVGCGNVLFGVASQAVLPQLASGAGLGRANALLELGDAATTIAGPAAAGAAIARTGAAYALVVNAASFLISGTVLRLFLPPLRPGRPAGPGRAGRAGSGTTRTSSAAVNRLLEPVRLLVRDRLQLTIQFALMALSAHGTGLVLAVVVLGKDELGLSVGQLGLVLSAAGVGGLIAGLLMARAAAAADRVRTVALTLLVAAGAAVALAGSPTFWMAVLANGVLDAFVTAGFVATATIRQSRTPNEVLGRVSAASTVANTLARAIGAGGVGLMLAAFGARTALALDAALLAIAGLVVLLRGGRSVPVRPAGERSSGPAQRDQPEPDHRSQDADPDEEVGTHQ